MSFTGIPEMKEGYGQLGARKFWLLMIGLLAWIGIATWLMISAVWPADCDPFPDTGGRRDRLFSVFVCSPRLLQGGAVEYAALLALYAPMLPAVYLVTRNLIVSRGRSILPPRPSSQPE